jgi:hypothetical protein
VLFVPGEAKILCQFSEWSKNRCQETATWRASWPEGYDRKPVFYCECHYKLIHSQRAAKDWRSLQAMVDISEMHIKQSDYAEWIKQEFEPALPPPLPVARDSTPSQVSQTPTHEVTPEDETRISRPSE